VHADIPATKSKYFLLSKSVTYEPEALLITNFKGFGVVLAWKLLKFSRIFFSS
tara:strand:- start:2528 stop:2686 length:159 start_codon:yes stop_codon:yes gene_type:complete